MKGTIFASSRHRHREFLAISVCSRASMYAVEIAKACTLSSMRYACFLTTANSGEDASYYWRVGIQHRWAAGFGDNALSYGPTHTLGAVTHTKQIGVLNKLRDVTFELSGGSSPAALTTVVLDNVALRRCYK